MSKLQILLNNLKLTNKKTQECRCCFSYVLLVPITHHVFLPMYEISMQCTCRYICNVNVDIHEMYM